MDRFFASARVRQWSGRELLDLGKRNVVGVLVNAIDYEAAVARIMSCAKAHQALTVSPLAVHGVMTGALDAAQRYRLNRLDLALPDGQPVRWALNWLHRTRLADRVYGPDLMLRLCEQASKDGLAIFLYGSRQVVLEALRANLQARLPHLKIAGARPSLFRQVTADEKQQIVEEILASEADIVFVGLGCPRQEVWAFEHRHLLSLPVIAVGAAFDFHAGVLAQAPPYLQRTGLEWAYRLAHEPRRLWKRYALLNPLYVALVLAQAANLKKFDPFSGVAPVSELRYG
jgi:exopolysaccharide biosynthesis WecB/TagA/CpsF family protein